LANSMDTRGFRYRDNRTYLRESKWNHVDTVLILVSCFLLILCFLLVIGTFSEISNIV
jgi:energy-coupling factor transporter transmembrane protein EcfT